MARRVFHYILPGAINHSSRTNAKTVAGIRSRHCFKFGVAGRRQMVMQTYSCFCQPCLNARPDCVHASFTTHGRIQVTLEAADVATEARAVNLEAEDDDDDEVQVQLASMLEPAMVLRNGTLLQGGVKSHLAMRRSVADVNEVQYEYYIARCTKPLHVLERRSKDDYGQWFNRGTAVVEVQYYELVDGQTSAQRQYVFPDHHKRALIPAAFVIYSHFRLTRDDATKVWTMAEAEHSAIITTLNLTDA
jgi:hypothetical protein